MRRFESRIALVAGGGRDIGRVCALRLAEEGARVAITYNAAKAGAEETLAAIEKAGGRAIMAKADLTRLAEAEDAVARTSRPTIMT